MTTSDKINFDACGPDAMIGAPVRDNDGGKLGKIEAVYFDDGGTKPEWAAVKGGLFAGHLTLVPLERGKWDGAELTVPFDKAAFQAAPHHVPDDALSESEEQALCHHYGISAGQDRRGEHG
ncbi:PRC-barrel domain-containing protein [Amycolatopsis minnesotensis]|uniref:PRC-barrel domain-containing protein n=1 Tax=Amycolatopsis minnesotensis TaxID=337894 RepID=A0ABP5C971_9PSEU